MWLTEGDPKTAALRVFALGCVVASVVVAIVTFLAS